MYPKSLEPPTTYWLRRRLSKRKNSFWQTSANIPTNQQKCINKIHHISDQLLQSVNTFVESSYMQINGPPPPSVFDSSSSKWNYSTMYVCMAAVLYLLFSFLGIIDINVIQGKSKLSSWMICTSLMPPKHMLGLLESNHMSRIMYSSELQLMWIAI